MKKTTHKSICCAILCLLIATVFAGCDIVKGGAANVDPVAKLTSLMVSDQTLGIAGKYTKLTEIEDGDIDTDLIGTWGSADGETTYTFTADGVMKATNKQYGDTQAAFTCVTINGYKILCEQVELSPETYDGAQAGDTQIVYTAYSVENDAMYQVIVEEVNKDYTSSVSALLMMYRCDESGSMAASIAKNPIDLKALNGTWSADKGSCRIQDGTLTLGENSYTLSLDGKNNLVVEKDGVSTVYHMALSMMKEYDYEDRTQYTASTMLGISFTGADENDKPNLLPVLEDYKTEYGYDSWYYSGSFKLQDGNGNANETRAEIKGSANLFQRGVWSASVDGEIDTYFVFYDETSGRTEHADGTGGVPFTCEQSGMDIVFHFGSRDDVTTATFGEGDNVGTFNYDDRTVVYAFDFIEDADVDTFEVPAN